MTTLIETERLILRTWKKEDARSYFKINQDPKVIEHLPSSLTIDQVNDFIQRMNNFTIDYLANRPDCLHACAAWAYGRWGVQKKDGSLDRAISMFKKGMQKDKLPYAFYRHVMLYLYAIYRHNKQYKRY